MDGGERDEDLVRRCAAGEAAALGVIYDRHGDVVFALLVRVVADRGTAEELLQEAFLRAWRHADSFDAARGGVRSWLFGIAHHLALNELRRRRRRPAEVPVDDASGERDAIPLVDAGPEPVETVWASVRREEVARAMADLPAEHRAVLELYAAGHTQSEIAARLEMPLGTVKTRMRRGLLRLRETLTARGIEAD